MYQSDNDGQESLKNLGVEVVRNLCQICQKLYDLNYFGDGCNEQKEEGVDPRECTMKRHGMG